jgi:phosphocarrier protein
VTLSKDGQSADGRSIMGILTLAAPQGSKVLVEASGEDAEQAVRAIERLIDKKFNEPE